MQFDMRYIYVSSKEAAFAEIRNSIEREREIRDFSLQEHAKVLEIKRNIIKKCSKV